MFDRLMGGAILADADRVMRPGVDDMEIGQCRETNRRTHVIGEDEEGPSERKHAAMCGHPVHDRAHCMFTDAVVDLTSVAVEFGEGIGTIDLDAGVSGQIGAATGETGDQRDQCVDNLLAGIAGGNTLADTPRRKGVLPAGKSFASESGIEFLPVLGPGRVHGIPCDAGFASAQPCLPHVLDHVLRRPERFVRHSQKCFGGGDLVGTERVAVSMGRIGELG
ncbi:unannotated protein [freshwater metagenome]|uniref:Unannotated protein n=1 Tax=freshwater metagenome TaxID=449393 RepID=A0A6J6I8R5_9ZZZZ